MPRKDNSLNRAMAHRHVEAVKEKLKCSSCGVPHLISTIEFHNDDHIEHPERRVSNMVKEVYSLKEIDEEISKCQPLCRSCHMQLDGRAEALNKASIWHRKGHRKSEYCIFCGRVYFPLRKDLCSRCYDHEYRFGWPTSKLFCQRGHPMFGKKLTFNQTNGHRYCKQCAQENYDRRMRKIWI